MYVCMYIYIYIGKRETKKKLQICSDSEFHVIQFSNCFHI